MNKSEAPAPKPVPRGLRLLNSNELVSLGDFVDDQDRGFALWEGPGGFRADSFVRPIYRRRASRLAAVRKKK